MNINKFKNKIVFAWYIKYYFFWLKKVEFSIAKDGTIGLETAFGILNSVLIDLVFGFEEILVAVGIINIFFAPTCLAYFEIDFPYTVIAFGVLNIRFENNLW